MERKLNEEADVGEGFMGSLPGESSCNETRSGWE